MNKFNLLKDKETLFFSDKFNDNYDEQINKIYFIDYSDIKNQKDNKEIQIVGTIKSIQKRLTKKGNFFGLVTIVYNNQELVQMMFDEKIKDLFKLDLNIPIVFTMRTKIPEFGIAMGVIDFKSIEVIEMEKK